jgi:DNA-binding NtrC family response regulator
MHPGRKKETAMCAEAAIPISDDPFPTPAPLLRLRAPRMLVVEDDLDLRNVVERVAHWVEPDLRMDWTTSVSPARELMRVNDYRLILADQFLEGRGTGLSLLRDQRRLQPGARFALMSAFPVSDLAPKGIPFLSKPFSVAECRGFLRAWLNLEVR